MTHLSRRNFLTLAGASAASLLLDVAPLGTRRSGLPAASAAEDPLARLVAGNKRFVAGKATHPNQGAQRRAALAAKQQPFASILSCADSRVPPEIVFDQGIGDLFVVRVAGNIAEVPGIGSLEFAATALGVPLIVVLGHSRCGAVDAALKAAPGTDLSPGLKSLVDAIRPAAQAAKDKPGDALANAIRANVVQVVGQLKASQPTLAGLVTDGKVRVVGAHYDLGTGAVEILA
jgi:carbonic anhydrase